MAPVWALEIITPGALLYCFDVDACKYGGSQMHALIRDPPRDCGFSASSLRYWKALCCKSSGRSAAPAVVPDLAAQSACKYLSFHHQGEPLQLQIALPRYCSPCSVETEIHAAGVYSAIN